MTPPPTPKVPGSAKASRPSRAAEAPSSPTRGRIVFGLVAVAVIGFAALVASLSAQESASLLTVDEVAGAVAVTGEALAPLPEDGGDLAIGSPAPVVTGQDFAGAEVVVGAAGRPQVLVFLASWCPVCQRELPGVVDAVEGGALPEDVELVAVVTSLDATRPNWPPQAWLETEGYTGTVLRDDALGSVSRAYGMTGTPFWVVVDANGTVVARISGYVEPSELPGLFELALVAG